jgi:crossover junction endodeoxyribonuclease RuvC
MRVLGIDCGTGRTGYGVIDSDGVCHRMVAAGIFKTNPADSLSVRILEITRGLRAVIAQYHPDVAAVEDIFHAVNTKSALKLAHVRGAVLLTIAESGLPIGEYSPLEVKTSVVGYGRAEKGQVQLMVQSLLELGGAIESEDAADAIAVAICHATQAHSAASMGAGR